MREMGGQGKKEMRNRSLLQEKLTRLQKPKPGRLRKDTGCLIPCQAGLREAKENEEGIVWSDLEKGRQSNGQFERDVQDIVRSMLLIPFGRGTGRQIG